MTRLLIVDDEENIREVVREYAELNGYDADEAQDGFEAIDKVKNSHYDCIILDVMMPRLDGFSACREIRKVSESPIIILSARTEEYDKLFGFELGVDDYVVKPFSPKELVLRVNNLMRRVYRDEDKYLSVDGYDIDENQRTVVEGSTQIELTTKEFDLLMMFVNNRGKAFPREKILEQVWEENYFGSDRVVDDTLRRLRKKMPNLSIKTIYGFGYKLG